MKNYKDHKQFRLQGHDYSGEGHYFITICTYNREPFFGDIQNHKIKLSLIGKATQKCWYEIPNHFSTVELDEFVIMPNHVHGIIVIKDESTEPDRTQDVAFLQTCDNDYEYKNKFGSQSNNISSIIRGFKIGVTKFVRNNNMIFKWQPRFHDRIIRSDNELNTIRQYIIENPTNWQTDRNNLQANPS